MRYLGRMLAARGAREEGHTGINSTGVGRVLFGVVEAERGAMQGPGALTRRGGN